jgi:hypothetical protein
MNRKIVKAVGLLISIALLSWGVVGHRAIGKIAENHLSPKARAAVQELLGGQSLADVATWADEVRPTPEYRHTGGWHFLNLPLGLNYADFEKQVKEKSEENVYSAVLKQEEIINDKTTTREAKVEALKFIVHFVGDLHQPMHISRAEDKGGNTIQLNYEGQGTNLHSVWDSKLIEHGGLTYEQLAEKYDHVSVAQIKQWQSDPIMKWIWESYEISSKLYAEVDAMKSRSIDDSYYQAHIGIIQDRIEKAGIRLAGLLNEVFKNGLAASAPGGSPAAAGTSGGAVTESAPAKTIDIQDAGKHIDENVNVCGKVFGSKDLGSMVLVNLGAAYPDQLLTMVLRGAAKSAAQGLDGKTVCLTGKVILYKDKPEIIVTDTAMVKVSN